MDIPFIDDVEVESLTPYDALIDAIRDAFREGGVSPVRHHHVVPGRAREDITMLLMPAWNATGDFGVKLAAIAPSNVERGIPTLNGVYILFSADTGEPRALLNAGALTARRTAAASALASRCLSREDATTLLVIGTGRVARQLIAAHCTVRPIEEVRIWGRNAASARALAELGKSDTGVRCVSVPDVATGAKGADIISAATSATSPVLAGDVVDPGTHIDLVGAYTPQMCEADVALVGRASQVFVDTIEGALDEAGDLLQAAEAGRFSFDEVVGDLRLIASNDASLRHNASDITLFKSVGVALEDLAAAELCLARR